MSDDERRDLNPLVSRVDALLRRHQETAVAANEDVPILTDVAEPGVAAVPALSHASLEALAAAIESAVLERIGDQIDRVVEERLARRFAELLDETLRELRGDITEGVKVMVRESIAAAVERTLASREPPSAPG